MALFAKRQPGARATTELKKRAIDSARGRYIYSQRIATVEPVFANIRHNKQLDRFTLRASRRSHAVAAELPGAQHREARAQRLRRHQGLKRGRKGQQWPRQDRRRWKNAPRSAKMAKTEAAA